MSGDLLAIGASAIRAYQTALGAVGDNVANAQTVGYARRTTQLTEGNASSKPNILYTNSTFFGGVDVAAINRATDMFRTSESRIAASAHGSAAAISNWMTVAENGLDDSATGVGASLAQVFAAGNTLAADPASRSSRSAFLTSITQTAQVISTSAGDLQRASVGIGDATRVAVDALNASMSSLATVNLAIRHTPPGTTGYNELSDQRDNLIDTIAQRLDVTVTVAPDGSATLASGNQPLVTNGTAAQMLAVTASDGRLSFSIANTPFTPISGELQGLATAANTVADRRASLDTVASDLTTALNQWQATGQTPAGTPGVALLTTTGGALGLSATVSNPDLVAAATTGAANGNALALSDLRASSGVEASWANIVSAQAQTTATAKTAEASTAARQSTADAARDSVEGVDLDREAADMLRFQQAYQAAARVIQAAKDTVDAIMKIS
ncbi:flagellar hook-associated protein FlgK (plasmid) [Sphingomonas paeninsulae]|uniref:Flagellar hook-associated protein 1 n=1 Tax=Sphingomonas paeninsulae TaxID=2319844 RepID=A0A494TIE9_SPHPE|nr:flagellar hook-associated protein FlgK [Sphingomonas paeninsulae]AYJ85208.1 flagellar hook-associated protein FlgK [Sphingomonas paeninsulae]